MLEDARGPAVQLLAVMFAVFIVPFSGDVKPALTHGLIAIKAQASLEEAGGLLPHRRVLGVDDHMEREFGDFTRIVLIVTHMVLDYGKRQSEPDLRGGQAHSRRFEHGAVHGVDEFGKRALGKLAIVGHGLLAQHWFTSLHDGQNLFFAAGFNQTFNIAVKFQVYFGVFPKHVFSFAAPAGGSCRME